MNHYKYRFVYCTCTSLFIGTSKTGSPIYIGNGSVVFFECDAEDILEADKKLTQACELNKINWSKEPFTQVSVEFHRLP